MSLTGIDITNFGVLISDVSRYGNQHISSPVEIPIKFVALDEQLKEANKTLSSKSQTAFVSSLIQHLDKRATAEEQNPSVKYRDNKITLDWTLKGNPNSFSMKLNDIEEDAIKTALLHGQACLSPELSSICRATFAAQKAIVSLYENFIDCERNHRAQFCQQPPLAPLLSWGGGPETWTTEATRTIGITNMAIVKLPIGYSTGGIFAWTALAHEVAGHDLLAAAKLIDEIHRNVKNALESRGSSLDITNYWTNNKRRINEIASDVLGVINLGPAAAIGLVGYLKGAFGGKLRAYSGTGDNHPADILRGIVIANITNQLDILSRSDWSNLIYTEVVKDWPKDKNKLAPISLDNINISAEEAMRSAEIVANSILSQPLGNLDKISLRDIRVWNNTDQQITNEIGPCLSRPRLGGAPEYCRQPIAKEHAKHIIAAATIESLKNIDERDLIFSNMLRLLERI